jgi:hypothetical protein
MLHLEGGPSASAHHVDGPPHESRGDTFRNEKVCQVEAGDPREHTHAEIRTGPDAADWRAFGETRRLTMASTTVCVALAQNTSA